MYSAKTLSRSRSLLFVYFLFPYRLQNIQWHSILSFILRFHLSFFFPFFPPLSFRQWYVWGQRNKWRVAVLYYKYAEWWNFYSTFLCERRTQRAINERSTEYKFRRLSLGWGIRFNLFSALSIYYQIFLPFSTLRWKKSVTWRGESRSDRRNGSVFIRVKRRILFLFFCWELSVEGINYVRAFPFSE